MFIAGAEVGVLLLSPPQETNIAAKAGAMAHF
jgi:hypothetical protein